MEGTGRLQVGRTSKVRTRRKRRLPVANIELRLAGAPMLSWLFAKTEPARLPRVHDVSVSQISLVDRERCAVLRATVVNPTKRKAAGPIEKRARKHDVAARTGAMTGSHPSCEALFNVPRSKIDQIETTELAPEQNTALSKAERAKSLSASLLVDSGAFVENFHGGGILG